MNDKNKLKSGGKNNKGARETSAPVLRQAMMRRLPQRLRASAEYRIPPVPALLEHYVQLFNTVWTGVGRVFSAEDLDKFRAALKQHLNEAWTTSQYSRVLVSFATDPPPQTSLSWRIVVEPVSMTDEYNHWVATRTPPLFGKHPDAKIFELAESLGAPADTPILDIGAGTGRNTLPLARAGFPADAVELAPSLAAILREEAEKEGLPMKVFEANVLDPNLGINPGSYRMLILAEVVASHFRTLGEVRELFKVAARLLAKDGLLVFSVFLTSDGYKPDDLARELGQIFWCNLFNRREMQEAHAGEPFQLVSDESVQGYEREHLPADAWPPTGWFETWTGGQDLFDLPAGKPPVELRWLVYRKTS
ncbi:MAG TPA: class I SAM-dependent methyltransferase [Polyangiaceae bacterium]|nr:class I SAM-dependent methyltransferase [Polyangiaceae bacterium]